MTFVKSIKFRLTIWYLVTLVALLLLFGMMAYFMLSHSLYQGLDDSLKLRVVRLEDSLKENEGHDFGDEGVELRGTVNSLADSSIVVAGLELFIDENTEIEGTLAVGAIVEVEVIAQDDGSFVSTEIEVGDDEGDLGDDDIELEGAIESLTDTRMVIGGLEIVIDESTEIKGIFLVGSTVETEVIVQDDGSLAATKIEIKEGGISFEDICESSFGERSDELTLIYNTDGNLLQQCGPAWGITKINRLVAQTLAGHTTVVTTETVDGREIRLYAAPLTGVPNIHAAVIVGGLTAEVKEVLEKFTYVLLFAALTTVVLAGSGGLLLAKRVLKPVEDITQTAREIGESDLSRRIEVRSDDELGRLALILNDMIARLEGAFSRQRQFTADASHELRMPLAVIQAESTLALQKERAESDYRKSLELISQEVAHMSALIDKLLFLARSDAGKEQLNFEPVNVKDLISNLATDAEILCREKGLLFQLGQIENLVVPGDRAKLKRLFLNLLDNAIRYTPSRGTVSVSIVRKGQMAVVAIRDTGIGIASEYIPHIFERFYRVDKARTRTEGGSGLGLAICQNVAEVHGGKIEIQSKVGEGSTFSVLLPLVEQA